MLLGYNDSIGCRVRNANPSEGLEKGKYRERQAWWKENIAFGSEGFVREVKGKLGARGLWREIMGTNGSYELRESTAVYEGDFALKNENLLNRCNKFTLNIVFILVFKGP